MSIQPARELFTLNVIQEMFRDESPNVGSLVKVNFEQKEIKIADDYPKVIIGQKQPIQANLSLRNWSLSLPLLLSVVCSGKNSAISKFSTTLLKHTTI